jgi:DNA-binding transcriptional MerR regulator
MNCAMTTTEFCRTAGLTERELQNWLDNGLLDAERVSRTGGGARREFTADQAERARLIKALQSKDAKLSQLARADLADLASELRALRNEPAASRDRPRRTMPR